MPKMEGVKAALAGQQPQGRPGTGGSGPRKSIHSVDWMTLQKIRSILLDQHPEDNAAPLMTNEVLTKVWLQVAAEEQKRLGLEGLSTRDHEFIAIRVAQSMREVDPQCLGTVDLDVWVHHMLLTRSSPPAMRAMLQINRLLEAAIQACPGILVSLQHAFEVAPAQSMENPELEVPSEREEAKTLSSVKKMAFREIISIFSRKLWHLRPGTKETPAKRRTDFSFRTPDEFIQNTVRAMELEGECVTPADFLALCLGRREWQVTLHLYDLSKGMASVLAPILLQEQLEGVWHTGIIVYGKEYYFGGDIYYDTPAETGFGKPRLTIHLGSTLRQKDELHAFIVDELKPTFSREAYDAARNNCNHFTDKVAMWLVGKHIPEEVIRQPDILMQTGLGRTLRPILTRLLGQYFEPQKTAEEVEGLGKIRPVGGKGPVESLPVNAREEDIYGATVVL
jgi:hypothetical protein